MSEESRNRLTRRALLGSVGAIGAGALTSSMAQAGSGGADTSPKPGPDVLHEPLTTAPQFENTGRWEADPLKVSGSDAYVDGEYLYQDFVYDDHGANTTDGSEPPEPAVSSKTTGDVVYPTDEETYHYNAADLLEFRVTETKEGLAYRITLNTMTDPAAAGVAIGIDADRNASTGGDTWGYGIGSLGDLGLDHVLVTWGEGAELDGAPVESSVDVERNQIEVTVPLDPDGETWRHYVAVGLFDANAKRFKQVQELPDAENPGGAHGENPPPIFNVGFRFDEPVGFLNLDGETLDQEVDETEESSGSRSPSEYGHWREHAQAKALSNRDISEFHADIDFAKLSDGRTEINVPQNGYLNRLYSTHYPLGHGTDGSALLGNVQPYAVYIPDGYRDDEPAPMHVELHGYTDTHNAVGVRTPDKLRQLGEQRDAIVLSPEGRGPGLFYTGAGELDVFEAWADLAAHYAVDPDRVTLGGHSMGGFGTFRLASLYPDLFAKAFTTSATTDGEGESMNRLVDNLRHIPLLMWHGSNDELVPVTTAVEYHSDLRDRGYRHELDVFDGFEHNTHHRLDDWGPAQAYLSGAAVTRAPSRVVYRRIPEFDDERFGFVHDGAYWLSDISVADGSASGLVEAHAKASGEAAPITADYEGTGDEPAPHTKHGTRWKEGLHDDPAQNALDLDLDGVTSLTVWVEEAGLDPKAELTLAVDTTSSVAIELVTSNKREVVNLPPGQHERTVVVHG